VISDRSDHNSPVNTMAKKRGGPGPPHKTYHARR